MPDSTRVPLIGLSPHGQQALFGLAAFRGLGEAERRDVAGRVLFVTPQGLPVTENLPEDHEGRTIYGLVLDPTPRKGREGSG